MSKIINVIDRSRIVQRENCERARFLNYDFDIDGEPTGLQRRVQNLPLLNGIELHEAHARILAGEAIEDVVALMKTRYTEQVSARGVYNEADPEGLIREQTAMLEALLRAFVLVWLPRILDEYDVVTIEKPMDYILAPGLVLKLRFDVVLRRKGDGQLVILDYKSMAYASDVWSKKLERSRQTSLYVLAAQELFGEPVEIAYLGIIKGMWRKDTAKSSPFYEQKIQSTPLLYAYALEGGVGTVYSPEYTPKKGFKKFRTYESPGLKEWVEGVLWQDHRQLLNDMFILNPPFAPLQSEMLRVKELVVREELAYLRRVENYRRMLAEAERVDSDQLRARAREYLDYVAAPMREERCFQYGMDSVCQFHYGICFNEGGIDVALTDGEYEPREPHHGTELEVAA